MKNYSLLILFSFLVSSCGPKNPIEQKNNIVERDTLAKVNEYQTIYYNQIKNYDDSTISNSSMLQVDLVYKQEESTSDSFHFHAFNLLDKEYVLTTNHESNGDTIVISGYQMSLVLSRESVAITNERIEQAHEINFEIDLGVNKKAIDAKENGKSYSEHYYTIEHKLNNYKARIHSGLPRCRDTGTSNVEFTDDSGSLSFQNAGNILLLEHDLDGDSLSETYLVDYTCCINNLKIYRISDKL